MGFPFTVTVIAAELYIKTRYTASCFKRYH
jgi:hypothetical protein